MPSSFGTVLIFGKTEPPLFLPDTRIWLWSQCNIYSQFAFPRCWEVHNNFLDQFLWCKNGVLAVILDFHCATSTALLFKAISNSSLFFEYTKAVLFVWYLCSYVSLFCLPWQVPVYPADDISQWPFRLFISLNYYEMVHGVKGWPISCHDIYVPESNWWPWWKPAFCWSEDGPGNNWSFISP